MNDENNKHRAAGVKTCETNKPTAGGVPPRTVRRENRLKDK